MPELGRYEKLPRPESIRAFIRFVKQKEFVVDVIQLEAQLFQIIRSDRSNLIVHLTNIYIVSEADVIEILLNNPETECIVTVSTWNKYTNSAKKEAKNQGVGLFTFNEFMGAIYYDHQRFIDYEKPDKRNQNNHRRSQFS